MIDMEGVSEDIAVSVFSLIVCFDMALSSIGIQTKKIGDSTSWPFKATSVYMDYTLGDL